MIKVYVLMMFFEWPGASSYTNTLPVVVDNLASSEQCAHVVRQTLNNKKADLRFGGYQCIEVWKVKQ